MMTKPTYRTLIAALGCAGLAFAAAPGAARGATTYHVDLNTLNGDFGSTASGAATLTLDQSGVAADHQSGTATLNVDLHATGLEDLSDIGGFHPGHIHGQFASNAGKPASQQGDGSFFDGNGGTPTNSTVPTLANADDSVDDGFIDFFEGRAPYGPVVLNLTKDQTQAAPDGTPPLNFFLQQVGSGDINPTDQFPTGTTFDRNTTYSFDLSDQDQRRQFNNLVGDDGTKLIDREIVLHGLTVPLAISQAIDDAAGVPSDSPIAGVPLPGEDGVMGTEDDLAFRVTAPVAAGEIELSTVPTPTAALAGLGMLGGLALRRRRRRRTA